jgi:polyhydroxybutyrate depolymerase
LNLSGQNLTPCFDDVTPEMQIRAFSLVTLILAASLLLAGCKEARERREAREAAGASTATVEAQSNAPSAPPEATSGPDTPVPGEAETGTAAPPAASAACGASGQPESFIETLDAGGVQRSYRLYIPASYDASTAAPLVLNFHGFASNALEQERYSGFPSLADREGFILATPEGTNDPQRWYIYGQLEAGYVDDFAFVDQLIDTISASYCIDPARVFATGISNGGGMSSLLGCKLNDRIAAIAPVAGSPYSELSCRGAGPMPVVAFHGTDDELVPFEGGPGGRLGLPVTGVRENMRQWAEHNGCNLTLQTERVAADVVLESYGGCADGADVHLYVIEDGGHTWPGARINVPGLGETTHSISASEIAWRFFSEHSKR